MKHTKITSKTTLKQTKANKKKSKQTKKVIK